MSDLLLATSILVFGMADILGDAQKHGTVAVPVVVIAGMSVATLWRCRAPLLFVASVMVLVLLLRTTVPNITDLNFVPVFVLLVPAYSVAAHDDRLRSAIGLATCLATFGVISAVGSGRGSWFFAAGMATAAWTIGRAVRARRLLALQLRRRAEAIALERADREALALAEERTRIANDLHAAVADRICAVLEQIRAAQQLLGSDLAAADQAMAEVESLARVALGEVRTILGVLRRGESERPLAPQPGIGQLPRLLDEVREHLPRLTLHVEGEPGPVPASVNLSVYRILQEALHTANARPSDDVDVSVRFVDHSVQLEVLGPAAANLAWPSPAITERTLLCGGALDVQTGFDRRTRLSVRIPCLFAYGPA